MTKESSPKEVYVLRDYDWKLQCILGTSSLANYQQNLVTLDLHIARPETVHSKIPYIKETVSIELNKDDLDKLISVLESSQEKFLKSHQ